MLKITFAILGILAANLLCAATAFAQTKPATPASQPATTQPVTPITITVKGFSLTALNAATTTVAKQNGRPTILRVPPGIYVLPSVWRLMNLSNVEVAAEGATLQMVAGAPTDPTGDCVELVNDINLKFHGPTLDGGPPRQWTETPHNLRIEGGSNIEVDHILSLRAPTDDIYICEYATLPSNVVIHDIIGIGANRNGMSWIGATGNNMAYRCTFTGIQQAKSQSPLGPWCAIDCEPEGGQVVTGLRLYEIISDGCDGGINLQPGGSNLSLTDSIIRNGKFGVRCWASGSLIERVITDQGIYLDSCDKCMLLSSIAATIQADTAGVENPCGHTISNSVAPVIDVHYCYGKVTLSGNLGQVKQ